MAEPDKKEDEVELKPLSAKHQLVQLEYIKCWVQTDAYKKVYPKSSLDAARNNAARLWADKNFLGHLAVLIEEKLMSEYEAHSLTSDIARGDMADLIETNGTVDLRKLKKMGLSKLIKKFKRKKTLYKSRKKDGEDKETIEIDLEMYSSQEALRDILKIHGKIKDRIDITSGDKPLEIRVVKASEANGSKGK